MNMFRILFFFSAVEYRDAVASAEANNGKYVFIEDFGKRLKSAIAFVSFVDAITTTAHASLII